jgi:formate dehydrogenase subunit gamma
MTRIFNEALCLEIIARHEGRAGPMLPVLHDIQAAFGFIPEAAMRLVAQRLNVTRAEVYGVVTFYPAGRRHLKICRAEACQAMGGAAMADAVLGRLGLDWGGTTPDGRLTVEPVYCLGLCACAPSAMLDDEPYARLTAESLTALALEAV